MKTIAIGIDGGSYDFVMEHLNELPFFRALYRKRQLKKLKSVFPPVTGPAWMSILTGKEVKTHGYFSFVYVDKSYNIRLLKQTEMKNNFITQLSKKHKKLLIVNIPFMYPPRRINGVLVSGMDTPKEAKIFTYPPSLSKKLMSLSYIIEPFLYKDKEKLFKELLFSLLKRLNVFNYLIENKKYDFSLLFIRETDIAQHFLWDKPDKILKFYKIIDSYLSSLVEEKCENNCSLIIFTDHGFGRIMKRINMNKLLIELGYLKLKTIPKKSNILINRRTASEIVNRIPLFSFIRKRLPSSILRFIYWKMKPEEEKYDIWYLLTNNLINWKKTMAFSISNRFIYINSRDKFKKGIVSSSMYKKTREEIMSRLRDYFDEKSLAIDVVKFEELFSKELKRVIYPDIVLVEKDGIEITSDFSGKSIEFLKKIHASHYLHNGIFGYYGSHFHSIKDVKSVKDLYKLFIEAVMK